MAHWFWQHPNKENLPHLYSKYGAEQSSEIVNCINTTNIKKNEPILEIGCNAGRNLIALWEAKYTYLTGLDINKTALDEFKKHQQFIEYENIILIHNNAEEQFRKFKPDRYSLIFSMATLQHIPYENDEELFPLIVRAIKPGGWLLTIEAELTTCSHARTFPRNYKEIFELSGLKQVHESDLNAKKNYKKRMFKKVVKNEMV